MFFKKFKPKYIAKVPINKQKNIYRYFYTNKEYMAYINGGKEKSENKNSIKKESAIVDKNGLLFNRANAIESLFNKNNKSIKDISDNHINIGKQLVNNISKSSTEISSKITNTFSITTKDIMEKVNNGKKTATKVLEKIGNSNIESLKTSSNEAIKLIVSSMLGGAIGLSISYKNIQEERSQRQLELERERQLELERERQLEQQLEREQQRDLMKPPTKIEEFLSDVPTKTEWYTKEEDQALVNPNYDPFSYEYSYNCAYCTTAYDLRRRGYDVEAAPNGNDYEGSNEEIRSWYRDAPEFTSFDDIVQNSGKVPYTYDECAEVIENELLQYGEGAYGQFGLYWTGGGGHSVVWEIENNKVVIRDAQTNETHDIRYYMDYVYYVDYLRTDNLELSENVRETFVAKGRKK